MRALKDLDTSLDQFIELMERKDKQEIPIKQQEALGFVSIIEEAMVKGFPYEVPKQYANLPQLKVGPDAHMPMVEWTLWSVLPGISRSGMTSMMNAACHCFSWLEDL